MTTKNLCPCCSGRSFNLCCQPFLSRKLMPETPEQLMRSRYTAYTLADIPYIEKTQSGKAAENFNADEAKQWTEQVKWCGLSVLNSNLNEVEYVARYMIGNQLYLLQERSQFEKIGEQWFYISGALIPHQPITLKSNQPCPCGSKKKFSQCCGKR
jgi:SEC-C motif domain protein